MLLTFVEFAVVVAPATFLAVLAFANLFRVHPDEAAIANLSHAANLCGLIAAVGVLSYMLATGVRELPLELGTWVSLEHSVEATNVAEHAVQHEPARAAGHFQFRLKFVYDRLSIPFAIMSFVLCGVIGAFAFRYLHLEPGFNRFFLLYAIFQLG